MILCDYAIDRYVRDEYFERLNSLSPVRRTVEMFDAEIELLTLEMREHDEIFGWFRFDGENRKFKSFDNCRTDDKTREVIERPQKFGSVVTVDRGHTLVDYGEILRFGLEHYEKEVYSELAASPENEYLLAMKDTVKCVKRFSDRMCAVADEKLKHCTEERRKTLLEIRTAVGKVPYKPAESFREAVQAVWIIHFLLPLIENAWYSISLGRFDEYMLPYYEKAVADGMSKDEIKAILRNLWELLNSYSDGACLLNVGHDGYNELSKLVIECQKEFAMPAPILGAVVSHDTPHDVWNTLIDEELFSMGQPTFYGREACVRTLCEKGLSPEKAENFSNNSCMGISVAGEEFNSMWGCVMTIPAILEAALCGGKLLKKDFAVPGISSVHSLDELWEMFEKAADYMFGICADAYDARAAEVERTYPDPFLSMLTKNCIKKHCDRISGAVYHNATIECMGMINAADGIAAVDELVFKKGKYTVSELAAAVAANYEGFDELHRDVLSCGKFGRDDNSDEYAVKVADILQRVIRSRNAKVPEGSRIFSPSLHTLDTNVAYGEKWCAGFDGRLDGEPFAKNAGPSNSVRAVSPTSMLLSCAKLPQYSFFGGQPIDVSFAPDTVKNRKAAIETLIAVYLEGGGIQFQVNSVSSAKLRKALDNPELYPKLVVRVGGYSVYFNSLSRRSREESVERLEKEGL